MDQKMDKDSRACSICNGSYLTVSSKTGRIKHIKDIGKDLLE